MKKASIADTERIDADSSYGAWWQFSVILSLTIALFAMSCAHLGMPPPPAKPCAALKVCTQPLALDPSVKTIPRRLLFGTNRYAYWMISPDANSLLHFRQEGSKFHLSIRTTEEKSEHVLYEAEFENMQPTWAKDSKHVYLIGKYKGSSDYVLESIDTTTKKRRSLYRTNCGLPIVVAYDIQEVILAGASCSAASRGSRYATRINLQSGEATTVPLPGRRRVMKWVADEQMRLRAIIVGGKTGKRAVMVRDSEQTPWRMLRAWGKGDRFRVYGFSNDGKALMLADNSKTDTMRLYWLNTADGTEKEIFHEPGQEIYFSYKKEGKPVAILSMGFRLHWHALDDSISDDLAFLRKELGGDNFKIFSPEMEARKWLVYAGSSNQARRVFIYDKEAKKLTLLEDEFRALASYQLAKSEPVTIKARDGLDLPSYLTLPPGKRQGRYPLVIMAHGGPENRFFDRFDPWVQLMVNRGYAVVQLNFRGSLGLGKKLYLAGRDAREGGATAEDIEDVFYWAKKRDDIDTSRVAVMGFSYGGYATLISLALNPDLFACGVDGFGPSDLVRINRLFVPAGGSLKDYRKRVYDKHADKVKAQRLSPLELVDRIKAPLLVAHSPGDRNVPVEHSNEIVAAARRAGKCVQYAYYPNEKHGFGHPENAADFAGRVERFLARHLCGRAEAFRREQGSSCEMH